MLEPDLTIALNTLKSDMVALTYCEDWPWILAGHGCDGANNPEIWHELCQIQSIIPYWVDAFRAATGVQFVGLSEFYVESLCLLSLQRRKVGGYVGVHKRGNCTSRTCGQLAWLRDTSVKNRNDDCLSIRMWDLTETLYDSTTVRHGTAPETCACSGTGPVQLGFMAGVLVLTR